MGIPIYGVDAFASEAFRGNPAAVCVVSGGTEARWMQSVAGEMNLSETAFVEPGIGGNWGLRWFTPGVEVDLCGHATLAAAHVLWQTGRVDGKEPIRFDTRSGRLECRWDGAGGVTMDFPERPAQAMAIPEGLPAALGSDVRWCGRSVDDLLVELPHAATVRGLNPDLAAIGRFPVRGVIVTAPSDGEGSDFVSRFFAPAVGVPEDPVTGSAHCTLAGYWAERLGKTRLVGRQVSRRGGMVGVCLKGGRVELTGSAVIVWRGEWVG
jgi:PhzF family phenazine biosynthesis protein